MVGEQLLKIQYNDIGQVKSRTSKDIQETLTWDPWGRLIEITSSNYVWKASYDALGRRIQTEYTPITKKFFWNDKGEFHVTTSLYDPEHEFQEIGVKKDQETYWKIYERGRVMRSCYSKLFDSLKLDFHTKIESQDRMARPFSPRSYRRKKQAGGSCVQQQPRRVYRRATENTETK